MKINMNIFQPDSKEYEWIKKLEIKHTMILRVKVKYAQDT